MLLAIIIFSRGRKQELHLLKNENKNKNKHLIGCIQALYVLSLLEPCSNMFASCVVQASAEPIDLKRINGTTVLGELDRNYLSIEDILKQSACL